MSGPAEPSAGRALKANQAPSTEYPAVRPTTVTLVMIATAVEAVGSALPASDADGAADAALSSGSMEAAMEPTTVGDAEGRLAVGPASAEADGASTGAAEASPLWSGAGSGVGSGVGRARTITASAPVESVPKTMA
jgi:hypothetical protein